MAQAAPISAGVVLPPRYKPEPNSYTLSLESRESEPLLRIPIYYAIVA